MFGIDIGINLSSVTVTDSKNKVFDYRLLFGDKKEQDQWIRVNTMSDGICEAIQEIFKSHPGVSIAPMIALEVPVSGYSRNPKSQSTIHMLYALIRRRLEVSYKYTVVSVHPLTAKSFARTMAWGTKRPKRIYMSGSSPDRKGYHLNKKGMVRAFKKVLGQEPEYNTILGRETLADSYFIALAGKKLLND